MTKRELIDLWNNLDEDTEIVFPHATSSTNGKIKKLIILTDMKNINLL